MNRKLFKLRKDLFAYFVDGKLIKSGELLDVGKYMELCGIREIMFALEVMEKQNHDVADFGINGGFLYSMDYSDAKMGFNYMSCV